MRGTGSGLVVIAVAALTAACATGAGFQLSPASPFARGTLSNQEAALREYVRNQDTIGIARAAAAEDDSLLRMLELALADHRLGRFAESNRLLQVADHLAEERYTKSISQNVAAVLVNDRGLDYTPAPHERAMMHYYGMLNYLALNDHENALVEARAASEFLRRYQRQNGRRTYTSDAAVEYLAGLLHEGDRDENDALVAFRRSSAAFSSYQSRYGVPAPRFVGADLADLARRAGLPDVEAETRAAFHLGANEGLSGAGTGTLLVMVENGYIAHRTEEKVYIPILPDEKSAITEGAADAAIVAGTTVLARTISLMVDREAAGHEYATQYEDGIMLAAVAANADLITMAWPRYRLEANGADSVTVSVDGVEQPAPVLDDLAAIAARGFEEEKPGILRRMIVRGLLKYAAVQKAGAEAENKGGVLGGFLARHLGGAVANATERADLRSWSLLPAEVRGIRFRVPAGTHHLQVRTAGAGGAAQVIDLGSVTVAAGATVVRSAFVTGDYQGDRTRFAAATQQVDFRAAADTSGLAEIPDAPPASHNVPSGPHGGPPFPPIAMAATPASSAQLRPAPTLTGLTLTRSDFHPLLGETGQFAARVQAPPGLPPADTVRLRLSLIVPGRSTPAPLGAGRSGEALLWDGMLDNKVIVPGRYSVLLEAGVPGVSRMALLARPLQVDVDAPYGTTLLADPAPFALEPERHTVTVDDPGARTGQIVLGLIASAAGAAGLAAGLNMIANAPNDPYTQDETSTTGTILAAGGGGVLFAGGIALFNGMLGTFTKSAEVPDSAAIARNIQAKLQYDRTLAAVRQRNDQVRNSVVVRERLVDGRQ